MRMKSYLAGLTLLVVCGMFGTFAFAEEEAAEEPAVKPFCDFSMTFFSKYVWRGMELSKGSLVMFPNVTVGVDAGKYGTFASNMWGDYDLSYEGEDPNSATWWETDWVLTYANSIPFSEESSLDCTFGWINYDVDGGEDQEIFFIFGLTNPQVNKIVSPSISIWRGIYYDPAATYINLAFYRSFAMDSWSEKTAGWSVDLGATFGHYSMPTNEPGVEDYSCWHDGFFTAGLTMPVNDWLSFAPSINYSFPLTDEADDYLKSVSFDGESSSFFYGGIALKMSF